MGAPGIAVGVTLGTQPPLSRVRTVLYAARAFGLDSVWAVDHFVSFFPRSIWDREFTWAATAGSTPDAYFDYQTLLGYVAPRAGRLRVAVGVTEPLRRHPVLIAQAFLTLSHLTRQPPILGIGAGERENVEPYGLDFSTPVAVVEEAVEIIRLCFASNGPFDYAGTHFRLQGAIMDLRPAPGNTPELWVAAHRPRMLRLTGRHGDGWYPTLPMSPAEYAAKLAVISAAAVEAGRDPAAITAGYQMFTVIGRSEHEARAMLESKSMRFMTLLAPDYVWQARGQTHPLGRGFRGMIDFVPSRYGRTEMEAILAAIPVDHIADSVVWGTPETVLARLRDYVDAGMRHVVIAPVSALISRRDAVFGLRATLSMLRTLKRGG